MLCFLKRRETGGIIRRGILLVRRVVIRVGMRRVIVFDGRRERGRKRCRRRRRRLGGRTGRRRVFFRTVGDELLKELGVDELLEEGVEVRMCGFDECLVVKVVRLCRGQEVVAVAGEDGGVEGQEAADELLGGRLGRDEVDGLLLLHLLLLLLLVLLDLGGLLGRRAEALLEAALRREAGEQRGERAGEALGEQGDVGVGRGEEVAGLDVDDDDVLLELRLVDVAPGGGLDAEDEGHGGGADVGHGAGHEGDVGVVPLEGVEEGDECLDDGAEGAEVAGDEDEAALEEEGAEELEQELRLDAADEGLEVGVVERGVADVGQDEGPAADELGGEAGDLEGLAWEGGEGRGLDLREEGGAVLEAGGEEGGGEGRHFLEHVGEEAEEGGGGAEGEGLGGEGGGGVEVAQDVAEVAAAVLVGEDEAEALEGQHGGGVVGVGGVVEGEKLEVGEAELDARVEQLLDVLGQGDRFVGVAVDHLDRRIGSGFQS